MDITQRPITFMTFPRHFWIGAGLICIAWPLNWALPGARTHLLFFPLWLGYCLLIDGLVLFRKGTSLLSRSLPAYIGLFLLSAPAWWLFELINWRTQNWEYVGRELFSDATYVVLASLSFSTVMPAVFGTAELVGSFELPRRLMNGPRVALSNGALVGYFLSGVTMLALLLAWPRYFFPFVWLSVFFMLEPVNVWLGRPSLARSVEQGNWRPVIALWAGSLICGFMWEMWNYLSFPRWIYHVPFVGFLHVFEMPLLGYGGYLPFGMELFALYQLVSGFVPGTQSDYLRIIDHHSKG